MAAGTFADHRPRARVAIAFVCGAMLTAAPGRVAGYDFGQLAELRNGRSFSITPENPTGRRGQGGAASSGIGAGRKGRPSVAVPPGATVVLADVRGPGVIRHIWLTVPTPTREWSPGPNLWRDLVLRMYWDGAKTPCVEAPLGDFFGIGQGASVPLVSEMMTVSEGRGFNSYWPMPFRRSARIEIENQGPVDFGPLLFFEIEGERVPSLDRGTAYFHAQWRRENPTTPAKDYTILEAEGRGHYVGTMLSLVPLSGLWWGEGEAKFYLDGDDALPSIAGTGTEDYFGSAWGIGEFNTPFHGCPLQDGGRVSLYRWHVPDPIRFKRKIRVTMQNIGWGVSGLFDRSDDVCSTAYWYQTEPHKDPPALPSVLERRPRRPLLP